MPEIWKDAFYSGPVVLADGRRIDYPDDEPARQHNRVQEMLKAGLPIPFAAEHQPGLNVNTPWEHLAQKTLGALGHVKDSRLGPEGQLEVLLEVPDEEDFKRLPKIRFVSPQFEHDITDGSGRKWPGRSLTHVAATMRPIQHRQKPFKAEGLSREWLSLAGYAEALAMADDKDTDDKGGEDAGGASIKGVIDALRETGMTIPDEVSTADELIIAIKAASGSQGGGETPAAETATTDASAPVMMSMQAELTLLKNELLKTKRRDLSRRLGALLSSRRISRTLHDKLAAQLKAEQLSLGKGGDLAGGKVLAAVEAYEQLEPANPFLDAEQLSADDVHEVAPPDPEEEQRSMREAGRKRAAVLNGEGRDDRRGK